MIKYVFRPRAIKTSPTLLANALGAKCRSDKWMSEHADTILQTDGPGSVFVYGASLRLLPAVYRRELEVVAAFCRLSKADQRAEIRGYGIQTPRLIDDPRNHVVPLSGSSVFVARPLRHRAGQGFRLVDAEGLRNVNPSEEYVSEFFPKTHEYRLIYVRGTHLLTLAKVVEDGTSSETAWNHAVGSRFVTINDWDRCRLRNTPVLSDLAACPIIQAADIVGVDVMYNRELGYSVCEFNFAPALTIEANLHKVAEFLQHASSSSD